MSLLLDALKKAEANKKNLQEQGGGTPESVKNEAIQLEPILPRPPRPYATVASQNNTQLGQLGQQQAQARSVLALKRSVTPAYSKGLLVILATLVACLLLAGAYFLWGARAASPDVVPVMQPVIGNPPTRAPDVLPPLNSKPAPLATPQEASNAVFAVKPVSASAPTAVFTERSQPSVASVVPVLQQPSVTASLMPSVIKAPLNPPSTDASSSYQKPVFSKTAAYQQAPDVRLLQAYQAGQQGNVAQASQLYQQVLQEDASQKEALLGLAIIAEQKNEAQKARQYYQKVLALYPKEPSAQMGVLRLDNVSAAQQQAILMQQKALTQEGKPRAGVDFALANIYATQGDWPAAQQAYFDAYRQDSTHPDYAYNLAVSLDQLQQSALALSYYQKAEALAISRRHQFDMLQLRARIQSLQAQTSPTASQEAP